MNTPTHALINWTVARWWGKGSFPRRAVLLGSIAPDVPLYLLSFGGAIWFRYVERLEPSEVAKHLFANLFYHDPGWISLHNFLHSPTVLLSFLAALLYRHRKRFWESAWSWFFASCMLHTLVDIPVHHDDGPLVFWPLNWSYRFASPVSYWDKNHYGAEMMVFEAGLALTLIVVAVIQRKKSLESDISLAEE